MPAETMSLAASSTDMSLKITSLRGTKHVKPVGGMMAVGMKTVFISRSLPMASATCFVASAVTNTIDQIPFDGNSISPTFWKPFDGSDAVTPDSKIRYQAP